MVNRLSPQDAMLYAMSDPQSCAHSGSLLIIERHADSMQFENLLALVESRLSYVPRYRQRIQMSALGIGRPVWVDDRGFDITYHLRRSALPQPGTRDQLNELVGRLMARPLDHNRPLWEMYLIEGVDRERMAILTKTHQALVDGPHACDVTDAIADYSAQPDDEHPDIWLPSAEPTGAALMVGAIAHIAIRPWELSETLRSVSAPVRAVSAIATTAARRLSEVVTGAADSAPTAALVGSAGAGRRFATVALDAQGCSAIAARRGVGVADVILAVIAGALRRWMLSRDISIAADAAVRAGVPLVGHSTSLLTSDRGGDATDDVAIVDLPVGEPNPVVRLTQIAQITQRYDVHNASTQPTPIIPDVGADTFHATASRTLATAAYRSFTVPLSMARGPASTQYITGNEVIENYPVLPLVPQRVIAIGVNRYHGSVFVALHADRGRMPDATAMQEFLRESFAELSEQLQR